MSIYPTISVRQPHASLIFATRDDTILLRPWAPTALIGRRIAIHASAHPFSRTEFRASFDAHCAKHLGLEYERDIPYGALLGTVQLAGIRLIATDAYEWTLRQPMRRKKPVLFTAPSGERMWRTQL